MCCPHGELTLPFTLVTNMKQNRMKSECPPLPRFHQGWPGAGAKATIQWPGFKSVLAL